MRTLRTSAPKEWVLRQPGGQELTLRLETGEAVTVGRDLTCDLTILDAGVSRHHATFSLEGEDLWLEDLHSQNGTFVNTERVYHTRILSGDIITLGRIPLNITARAARHEETDPLCRLSQDSLARLVHVAREFAAEKDRAMVFQRLLELALGAVKAERGVVYLWEESRNHFHPVAASPQDLFQDASRLIHASLAASIVRGNKARMIGELAHPGVGSAIATPLFAGEKALGLLYLDRITGQRSFQPADADLLYAFAWVTSSALSIFSQLSESRDSFDRLESLVSARTREIDGFRARRHEPEERSGQGGTIGTREILEDVELFLAQARTALEKSADPSPDEARGAAVDALHAARLCIEAVRRLADRHPERYEETAIERIIVQVSGLDKNRRFYTIDSGGGFTVFCDPEELLLSLRLLSESILGRPAKASAPIAVSAVPSSESGLLRLRLTRGSGDSASGGPAPAPVTAGLLAADPRQLPEQLGRRIVEERLHGGIETAPDGSWFEVHVPQPAASLGETVILPGKN